jgi:putative Ig domain-containing protein/prealbumin domain-containing protein
LPGQMTTCSITNTKRGSIRIVKNTEGGDDTFNFTSNFNVSQITTSNGTGSQTVNAVPGSNYSISEQDKAGWDKGTFNCDRGNAAAIQVVAGEMTTCTIKNTKQGSITIEKKTVGGDGTFTFTGNVGVTSLTTVNNIASQTVNNLTSNPSTPYHIEETAQPGWDNGTFSCDNGSASNITVLPGKTTKCTITNTMQSSIKIVKNTVGGDGTFSFNSNFGVTPITTTGGSGSQVIGNLNAGGSYSIREIDQPGWEEGEFSCDNGTTSAQAIQVLAGKLTTCTITNTKQGSVTITKTTVGGNGTFAFSGTLGLTSLSTSNLTATQTFNNLKPGTYTVAETDPTPAFDFTNLVCTDPTGNTSITIASRLASIVLEPGETVSCTFVNTKRGAITIEKRTIGADDTFNFVTTNFNIGSITTNGGFGSKTAQNLTPGSNYSIAEEDKLDWVQGTWDCGSSLPSAIQVVAGQTTVCKITNTKPAKLTLTKILNPAAGNNDKFNLNIDGVIKAPAVGNGGTTGPVVVTTGVKHKVGETAAVGSLSDYVWTYSGDCAADGTVTLQYGDNKTCYVTNNKKGKVQLTKTVNPADHETPVTWDFVLRKGANSSSSSGTVLESGSVDGANGGTINFNTLLIPGEHYQLCEQITMPGWFTTIGPNAWALYNPDGNNVGEICTDFTVSPGETRSFAVNNYIPSSGGLGSTIGFWKNWASCKKSNGKQKPILDYTLALSEMLNPPPYGPGITIGTLTLHGNYAVPQIAPDCAKAVALLNKSTIDKGTKMASDPAFGTAAQLLGAILNVDAGAAMCNNHRTILNYADTLLAAHNFDGRANYTPLSAAEASLMRYLGSELDNYNNNGLCPNSLPVLPPVAPVFTSANQVTFTSGVPATFQVRAIGGFPLTLSESGALPAGVTFDPQTGVLSYDGTVQAASTTTVTFTAANNTGGTVDQSFTVKLQ